VVEAAIGVGAPSSVLVEAELGAVDGVVGLAA